MKYISVCSGIEAATVAWHGLGWEPLAFSEIEPFPCKVLAYHYPNVPNLGDMTKYKDWPDYEPDLLIGGSPCQSFSVAGLRKGLDDPRGNLMLTYLGIADRYKPKWILFENVPGLLSSNRGRDFGTFLGALGKLGYGFAYRILDAQYCRTHEHYGAVPQRRRRLFVVGCLGNWQRAAAVLFDSESMCGNPPPSRKAGQNITARSGSGITSGGANVTVAGTLGARTGISVGAQDAACGHMLAVAPTLDRSYADKQGLDNRHINTSLPNVSMCLNAGGMGRSDAETETLIPTIGGDFDVEAIALVGNVIGRSPENGGNGTGLVKSGAMYTLTKTDIHAVCTQPPAVAFQQNTRDEVRLISGDGQIVGALSAQAGMKQQNYVACDCADTKGVGANQTTGFKGDICATLPAMQVRRLTPLECERLQGFPDNYSNIPGASDSARYKALGNSMACNVMQLLGQRIAMVDALDY